MTDLTAIAKAMNEEASKNGKARRRLADGLRLTLWRDGYDWILSLTRRDRQATATERQNCLTAFGFPKDAELELDHADGYCITRLRWRRAEQMSFAGSGEAQARNQYEAGY